MHSLTVDCEILLNEEKVAAVVTVENIEAEDTGLKQF